MGFMPEAHHFFGLHFRQLTKQFSRGAGAFERIRNVRADVSSRIWSNISLIRSLSNGTTSTSLTFGNVINFEEAEARYVEAITPPKL